MVTAIQPYSMEPLRRAPDPDLERLGAKGYIDLALERAYASRSPGKPSQIIQMPEAERAREIEARYRTLEQMADFDDELMEELLNEHEPARDLIMADLARETAELKIVPVFLGSAENGSGVRRLMKALRHEMPELRSAARRVDADGRSAVVLKTRHAGQAGRQDAGARDVGRDLGWRAGDAARRHRPSASPASSRCRANPRPSSTRRWRATSSASAVSRKPDAATS